jgi:hypothetical protein
VVDQGERAQGTNGASEDPPAAPSTAGFCHKVHRCPLFAEILAPKRLLSLWHLERAIWGDVAARHVRFLTAQQWAFHSATA